ncbi:hypothetical protein DE146DRAFT_731697 [Phaeosphaeria sp. MPI-PUGE-AT-0046c]|nr:hypothetical protein DE146DRAFT_731697 [Phaeosphaeria sp. MPI-PUGE-AT-0046c]
MSPRRQSQSYPTSSVSNNAVGLLILAVPIFSLWYFLRNVTTPNQYDRDSSDLSEEDDGLAYGSDTDANSDNGHDPAGKARVAPKVTFESPRKPASPTVRPAKAPEPQAQEDHQRWRHALGAARAVTHIRRNRSSYSHSTRPNDGDGYGEVLPSVLVNQGTMQVKGIRSVKADFEGMGRWGAHLLVRFSTKRAVLSLDPAALKHDEAAPHPRKSLKSIAELKLALVALPSPSPFAFLLFAASRQLWHSSTENTHYTITHHVKVTGNISVCKGIDPAEADDDVLDDPLYDAIDDALDGVSQEQKEKKNAANDDEHGQELLDNTLPEPLERHDDKGKGNCTATIIEEIDEFDSHIIDVFPIVQPGDASVMESGYLGVEAQSAAALLGSSPPDDDMLVTEPVLMRKASKKDKKKKKSRISSTEELVNEGGMQVKGIHTALGDFDVED